MTTSKNPAGFLECPDSSMVTVIIVSWNTRDYLKRCLDSVFAKNRTIPFDVFVVDNNSSDGSAEMVRSEFSQVKLIGNQENIGFSRANNQAMALSKSKYYLLLNSDTELRTNEPLSELVKYLEDNAKLGILGGRLVFPDGTLQTAGREFTSLWGLIKDQLLFFRSPFVLRMTRGAVQQSPVEVDYVDGAFLCIRREVVEQVGPMDESFFLYGEDMEWCLRARQAGWKVVVLPQIEVTHYHSASTAQNLSLAMQNSLWNKCRALNSLHGETHARLGYYVCLVGMLLRVILIFFPQRQKARAYWQALRCCLRTGAIV